MLRGPAGRDGTPPALLCFWDRGMGKGWEVLACCFQDIKPSFLHTSKLRNRYMPGNTSRHQKNSDLVSLSERIRESCTACNPIVRISYLAYFHAAGSSSTCCGGEGSAITEYIDKGKWQETPFTAELSCSQVPPSVCFSASYLSSCIVSIKIAVSGGWN